MAIEKGKAMKRRHILGAVAAAATGTGVAAVLGKDTKAVTKKTTEKGIAAPNISKDLKQFRMATTWPKDFPGLGQMPNRFKGFSFFTAVPMGMTAAEIMGWIDHGGGQKLWDDLSADFNIKPFQAGNTGHQTGGWFKREMNSLEDFKGLKMRMPGLGGEVIRRMGGAAVQLSGGEIYQALQSGSIDATEWVGPWNDYAFGFHREAPYYYAPGFHEPGAKAANDASLGEYTHENAKALNILKNEHGIAPRFFSQDIMVEIGKISEDVVAELGSSDARTKKIYDAYLAARNEYRGWTEMSDGRYIRAREVALNK